MALMVVDKVRAETPTVSSFYLVPEDGSAPPGFAPGQFVPVRPPHGSHPCFYSLSDRPGAPYWRLTVKRTASATSGCSGPMHSLLPGARVEVGDAQGDFVPTPGGTGPLVLVSAGVGVTPMMAILADHFFRKSLRPIWFVQGSRNRREQVFGDEVRDVASGTPGARVHFVFSQPGPRDREGVDFHSRGRITGDLVHGLVPAPGAEYLLCGPAGFLRDVGARLQELGVPGEQIRVESFGAGSAAPQPSGTPRLEPETPEVVFGYSGIKAVWSAETASLLELAESSGLQPDYYCRAGICHTCECPLLSGEVKYTLPVPRLPEKGRVLICCATPKGRVVLGL